MTIAVIDYGMGNLNSVAKALNHVNPDVAVEITADPERIRAAERVVFPGQGAMGSCMAELTARGLQDAVHEAAKNKPFLGICVGLQLVFTHSEEGDVAGLAIIDGNVKKFPSVGEFKVPHMGWNTVNYQAHAMWQGIAQDARFYFVHSYYVCPTEEQYISATTEHAVVFTSAIAHDNLFAVQFHPEKSGRDGLCLLSNFVKWRP